MSATDAGYTPDHPEVRITQTDDTDDAAGVLRLDLTREQLAVLARRAKRVDTEAGSLLPVSFGLATTRTLAHQCERLADAEDAPVAAVTVGGPDASERVSVSVGVVLAADQARQLAADAAAAVENAEKEDDEDADDEDEAETPVVFRWQLQFTPETAALFVHQARVALEADEPVLAVKEVDWEDVGET